MNQENIIHRCTQINTDKTNGFFNLKKSVFICVYLWTIVFLFAFQTFGQIAVKGETIWTMAGEPIVNGVVLINNG